MNLSTDEKCEYICILHMTDLRQYADDEDGGS